MNLPENSPTQESAFDRWRPALVAFAILATVIAIGVLRSENDDVDAAFQAPIEVRKVGDIFEIGILCQMSSDDLQTRLDVGDAAYGLHVECTRSFFREIYQFKLTIQNTQ